MSDTDNTTLWTFIIQPDNPDEKPTWAAWVAADNANWGTLRIFHVPTQQIVLHEEVQTGFDISALWTGRTQEQEWEELVRNWVAARENDPEYAHE